MTGGELLDLERCRAHVRDAVRPTWRGRVEIVSGVIVEATGAPAAMGELCSIDRGPLGRIAAEVVGFRGSSTLLMPHGSVEGIGPRQLVTALGRPFAVPVGDELLGRVLDGYGAPIDGRSLPRTLEPRAVRNEAPAPLGRAPIDRPLQTGVRAIDATVTLGRGQRLGIFSGSGVGKSTLLGQIARGTDADVIVVAFGTPAKYVRAAVTRLRAEGARIGFVRPITLLPFPSEILAQAARGARTVAVYENSQGQMIDDVRLSLEGAVPVQFIGRLSLDSSGFGIAPDLDGDYLRDRLLEVLNA
jgi:flagellar biosynthesis/type III secretory pathway ATPase